MEKSISKKIEEIFEPATKECLNVKYLSNYEIAVKIEPKCPGSMMVNSMIFLAMSRIGFKRVAKRIDGVVKYLWCVKLKSKQ